MTELQLYKFIQDKEWRKDINENGEEDIFLIIPFYVLEQFTNLIKSFLVDESFPVYLKDTYICVWIYEICEHYDIDIEEVFDVELNRG